MEDYILHEPYPTRIFPENWSVVRAANKRRYEFFGKWNLLFSISEQLISIFPAGFIALEKRLLPFLEDYFELRRRCLYEYPPHMSGPLPGALYSPPPNPCGLVRVVRVVRADFFMQFHQPIFKFPSESCPSLVRVKS